MCAQVDNIWFRHTCVTGTLQKEQHAAPIYVLIGNQFDYSGGKLFPTFSHLILKLVPIV